MMPTCRTMDSYPYQRNQIQFPHYYYYPNIEPNPPQMKMEPPKPPFPYEQQPWNYAGNYGHPMNFCCGHNNFPGCYSYRPSYHHHAPPVPSPMYYSGGGGYPAYGEPFLVPYSPQPHYTMELPRYEYDKYMPREFHCCGCPNHPCHQDTKGIVKIEEEEPEGGGKKVSDDTVAPIQMMRNYPYPIVWIPPEYTSNKEAKNAAPMAEVGEPCSPRDRKADEDEPRGRWNGWIPFDMNRAPNAVHEGDGRRRSSNQNLQGEKNIRDAEDGRMNNKSRSYQKRSEFPFPIIWMPYYNKQEEESGKENNDDNTCKPKCVEEVKEVPHSFKFFPVNPPKADEGVMKGTRSNQVGSTDRNGADVTKKVTNEKIIPVKEVELHQEKIDSEESGGKRERIIPVKQMEENVTKKDSREGEEKKSTSPRKNGKLPPVCLRVDLLLRKKNGNGSSRSPSPPASKEHSTKPTIGEKSKASSGCLDGKAQSNSDGQNAPNIGEKVEPKERTIQVSEAKANEGSRFSSPPASEEHSQVKGGETSKTTSGSLNDKAQPNSSPWNDKADGNKEEKEISSVGEKEENKEEKGVKNMAEEEVTEVKEVKDSSKPTDEGRKEKKVLLDVDAAVLIQAAYRGYQVRKWDPLKKLKQIDEVSKELIDVRGRVEALEHSSDLRNDGKQRIAIGETIMRLLLKLDTIQGLHSSFREIRKSMARELIALQERLDTIMTAKPQQQTQEFADTKPVEETPMIMQNEEENMQEEQEEKAEVPTEDSAEGINHDTVEKCEEDQSQLLADPISNEGQELIVPPNETVDEFNLTSEVSEAEKMVVEPESKSEAENIPIEVGYSDLNAWRELPVGVIEEDAIDHSTMKNEENYHSTILVMDQNLPPMEHDSGCYTEDSDIDPIRELPVGVLDDDVAATSEVGNDDGSKVSEEEPRHGDGDVESLVELPVGVFYEDIAKPESENYVDEPETSKEDEGAQCNIDGNMSYAIEDTAEDTRVQQQEEVQSSGESDGWVKVEFHKDENKGDDASRDIEIEYGKEAKNEAESLNLATQADNGNECMIENVPIDDFDREEQQEEKIAQEEAQVKDQDFLAEQGNTETMNKKKTTELSAESPTTPESEVLDAAAAEHDKGLNGDKKLLEENEKLTEMMKKLLEAGNEQMNVITDLTGRVKDLEKKLARSKRVKTKRFKPAPSKIGSNSNNSSHERVISVAM